VIRLTEKFILVGDHNQLPPVIQNEEAKDLTQTMFETLYTNPNTPKSCKVMLNIQHRMPGSISDFISNEFYDGKLSSSDDAISRTLNVDMKDSIYSEIFKPEFSMALINIKSSMGYNSFQKISKSEGKIVVSILGDLLRQGIMPEQVGIIAPFRAQVAEIRRQIELDLFKYFKKSKEIHAIIDTIDRFQGGERDIIIFSLTLMDETIPVVLQDKRRLNVAISRARKKFIGLGNWDMVDGSDTLKHLKEYVLGSGNCILIDNPD
jgi:Superfamily I DNA and RNA helicases and helicase subunits